MKKLINLLGIIALIFVAIINIFFTAHIDLYEQITIIINTPTYLFSLILLMISIYMLTMIINIYLYKNQNITLEKKIRKIILILIITIYIAINILIITKIQPKLLGDSREVYRLAKIFYAGNEQDLSKLAYPKITLKEYIQAYHQQIPIAFIFNLIFRIFNNDSVILLRILNVIANIGIVFAIYKIAKQISKKHEINITLLFTLILTFLTLPMYVTFVYGDIPSILFCFLSVYFIMKYIDSNKIRYSIISAIFIMIANMLRMNSLIFIIATIIYLILNLFKEIHNYNLKQNLKSISIIIVYIIIGIIPSILVKNYYINKYDLDKTKEYPNSSYFLMAMTESWRGSGWYNENIGEPALKNPKEKKEEYPIMIKERLNYFIQNPKECLNFYLRKQISMWSENTYSGVRNNLTKRDLFEKASLITELYQKAILILMCIISIIILFKNKNNLSLEILFLVTIFLGGFSFHILWEAKSRYIIPYVLALIPIASVKINTINLKNIFKNIIIKK